MSPDQEFTGGFQLAIVSRRNRLLPAQCLGHRPALVSRALRDFMLTTKTQEIMANQGRWVSRKDVKYQVDPGQRKQQVVSHEKWGERTAELVQLYNRLIMRDAK